MRFAVTVSTDSPSSGIHALLLALEPEDLPEIERAAERLGAFADMLRAVLIKPPAPAPLPEPAPVPEPAPGNSEPPAPQKAPGGAHPDGPNRAVAAENRDKILRFLRANGPATATEIAAATELTKVTVYNQAAANPDLFRKTGAGTRHSPTRFALCAAPGASTPSDSRESPDASPDSTAA